MVRVGQEAIDYARSRIGANSMPASGYCLQFVRQCFDVGSYYGSAIDAWRGAVRPHPGDYNPPPAVPLYFTTPSQYDHVVFCAAQGGTEIISTFNADVRSFNSIASIEANFDGQYLGWAEDINCVQVYAPAPGPDPVPPPDLRLWEDDDMRLIRIVDDGRIIAVSTYNFDQVPSMERYAALAKIWGAYEDVSIMEGQHINDEVNENIVNYANSLKGQGIGGGSVSTDTATVNAAIEALKRLLALLYRLRRGRHGGHGHHHDHPWPERDEYDYDYTYTDV